MVVPPMLDPVGVCRILLSSGNVVGVDVGSVVCVRVSPDFDGSEVGTVGGVWSESGGFDDVEGGAEPELLKSRVEVIVMDDEGTLLVMVSEDPELNGREVFVDPSAVDVLSELRGKP
jgi:hypothetical protein